MQKPISIISCTTIGVFFLLASNASADLYTIEDNWIDWPEHTTTFADTINDPSIDRMELTIENNYLKTINVIFETDSRVTFDSLFLNTSWDSSDAESWDNWDYFVHDGGTATGVYNGATDTFTEYSSTSSGTAPSDGLYAVNGSPEETDFYTRIISGGRDNNTPNGIDNNFLDSWIDFAPTFDATYESGLDGFEAMLTYDFSYLNGGNGLALENGIFVAYSPYCANDIIGGGIAPVPEPATMLLFGAGLVGLAGHRLRRKKN